MSIARRPSGQGCFSRASLRPRATTLRTKSSKPRVGNRLALLTIRLTLSVCTCPYQGVKMLRLYTQAAQGAKADAGRCLCDLPSGAVLSGPGKCCPISTDDHFKGTNWPGKDRLTTMDTQIRSLNSKGVGKTPQPLPLKSSSRQRPMASLSHLGPKAPIPRPLQGCPHQDPGRERCSWGLCHLRACPRASDQC